MNTNQHLIREIPNGDRAPKVNRSTVTKGSDLTVARANARYADLRKAAKASLVTYTFVTPTVANMVFDGIISLESAKFYGLTRVKA